MFTTFRHFKIYESGRQVFYGHTEDEEKGVRKVRRVARKSYQQQRSLIGAYPQSHTKLNATVQTSKPKHVN